MLFCTGFLQDTAILNKLNSGILAFYIIYIAIIPERGIKLNGLD